MRYLFLILILLSNKLEAQVDIIVKLDNDSLRVEVTEVSYDEVKYKFPQENHNNVIAKNLVKKIYFASGRVEDYGFEEPEVIKSCLDYKKVKVTDLEDDTKGLEKLEKIFVKATGYTRISARTNVQNRATEKLSILAAFLGAPLVYILDNDFQGAVYGENAGRTAEYSISGMTYVYNKVSRDSIRAGNYRVMQSYKFGYNSAGLELVMDIFDQIEIDPKSVVIKPDGYSYVRYDALGLNEFRVIYADSTVLVLCGESFRKNGKYTYYNLILSNDFILKEDMVRQD